MVETVGLPKTTWATDYFINLKIFQSSSLIVYLLIWQVFYINRIQEYFTYTSGSASIVGWNITIKTERATYKKHGYFG